MDDERITTGRPPPTRTDAVDARLGAKAFHDPDGRWVGWAGWIQNDAGDVSGWHHHATNHTHVYVIRGSVTVEFCPSGSERIVAGAGDFFIVPSNTIHRELTGEDSDLEAFVVRVGGEPEEVGAGRPEPDAEPQER